MDIESLARMIATHPGEIVLRYVDSGRECQFWLFPGGADSLEEWWRSQESFDSNPNGEFDELYRLLGKEPPPRRTLVLPGIFIDADYPEGTDLWESMSQKRKHYFCELCCDTDSYLRRPDGTRIHHRGDRSSIN
jgi:hypothetical protein